MVSDELLLLMKPMNSTDMIVSMFVSLKAQRPSAARPSADAGGIVLRRVHAAAQDIAIVPLQRIGAGQAVIAGQRQRILDHGDGVVGHRQLDRRWIRSR